MKKWIFIMALIFNAHGTVVFEKIRLTDEGFISEFVFTISKYTLVIDKEGYLNNIEVNTGYGKLNYLRYENDFYVDLDYPRNSCYFSSGRLYLVEEESIVYEKGRNKIESLGNIKFQYSNQRLVRIDWINFEYDHRSNRLITVGNVQIKYNSQNNKIERVISYPCKNRCAPPIVIVNKVRN